MPSAAHSASAGRLETPSSQIEGTSSRSTTPAHQNGLGWIQAQVPVFLLPPGPPLAEVAADAVPPPRPPER